MIFQHRLKEVLPQLLTKELHFQNISFVGSTDLAANDNWGAFFSNIPDASGGYALNDFIGNTQLRIEFPINVTRVGILLSTSQITSWTMIAWGNSGNFLEATNASMPSDASGVFLGLELSEGINYIE